MDERGELVVVAVDGGRFVGAFVVVVVVVPGRTQSEDGGGAEVFEGNSHLKEQKSRKFCCLVSFFQNMWKRIQHLIQKRMMLMNNRKSNFFK